MEYYCLNAESLDSEGMRVPRFCIGALCGDRASIVTEDLTAGGEQVFEHYSDLDYGYIIRDSKREKVMVDIDVIFARPVFDTLKYFSEEARITVT